MEMSEGRMKMSGVRKKCWERNVNVGIKMKMSGQKCKCRDKNVNVGTKMKMSGARNKSQPVPRVWLGGSRGARPGDACRWCGGGRTR